MRPGLEAQRPQLLGFHPNPIFSSPIILPTIILPIFFSSLFFIPLSPIPLSRSSFLGCGFAAMGGPLPPIEAAVGSWSFKRLKCYESANTSAE